MSAYLNTLQNLASAWLLGICFYAAFSTVVILFRGRAGPPLQDRRRTSLVLFLKLAAFWAKIAFLNFAMPSNNACQVTVVFSTLFDQAARTVLSAFLIWSASNGLDTQLKRLGLGMFVGLRFVLGAVFAGFIRPQFANVCVARTTSTGFPVTLLLIDGFVLACLISRMFTTGIWADTREVRSSTRKEQSKGLVALGLGYLLWFAMSTPMIMGFAHIPLFFRTAFPAIGIVILTVIINYFSGALALQRERRERHPYNKRGLSFDTNSDRVERSPIGQHLPGYDFSSHERQNSLFQVQPSGNPKELPRSFQSIRQLETHTPTTQADTSSTNRSMTPVNNYSVSTPQFLPELDFTTLTEGDWLSQERLTTKSRNLLDGISSGVKQLDSGSSPTQAGGVTDSAPVNPTSTQKGLTLESSSQPPPSIVFQEESIRSTTQQLKRKAVGNDATQRSYTKAAQISPLAIPHPLTRDNSWLDTRSSDISVNPADRRCSADQTFRSNEDHNLSPVALDDHSQRMEGTVLSPCRPGPKTNITPLWPHTISRVPSPSRSLKRKQNGDSYIQSQRPANATRADSAAWMSPCTLPSQDVLSSPSPLSSPKVNYQPQSSPVLSAVDSVKEPLRVNSTESHTTKNTLSLATEQVGTSRRRTLVVVDDTGTEEFFGDILVENDTLELLFPAPPTSLARPAQSPSQPNLSPDTNHVEEVEQRPSKPSPNRASKLVQLEACAPVALPDLVIDTGSSSSSRPSSAESAQSVGGSRGHVTVSADGKSSKLSEGATYDSQKQSCRSSRRPSVVCVEGKLSSTSGKESRLSGSTKGLLAIHSKQRNSVASTLSEQSRERVPIGAASDHAIEQRSGQSSVVDDHQSKHATMDFESVTEEIVMVMLDTDEANSIFWDTADDLRCFRIKPLTQSPKSRRKTMPWHCRIGQAPPTFSGRRKQRNSKTAPPPVPLLLGTRKSAPGTLGLNKPLPDESQAMRDIQEQLRKFEQPPTDVAKITPQQSEATTGASNNQAALMKTLDHEIGRQRKYWLDLHQNLNNDSSTTDEEGSTAPQQRRSAKKSTRPISRYSQIRDKFEAQTHPKPPVPSKSIRRASTHRTQTSRDDPLKERLGGPRGQHSWKHMSTGQQTALSLKSSNAMSNAVQILNRWDESWTVNTTLESSDDHPRTDRGSDIPQSNEILSTKVYKPITELWRPACSASQNTVDQLWTPPTVNDPQRRDIGHHDAPTRRHRCAKRFPEEPLTISSTSLWMNKPAEIALSHGLWGTKPNPSEAITPPRAARKPFRKSRRTTLLPDIVESPKPVPGKEGALGVFQWPWGPSDSAQIQPMYPPPPPPVAVPPVAEFSTSFDPNEYEMATEAEDEYSSYFEDYDDEGFSTEDDFDESGFWQLYSKVQSQAMPLKDDGYVSEVRIVEDYADQEIGDPDADSVYDVDTTEAEAGRMSKVSPTLLGDEYRYEGVVLQHSPMTAA